jgi:outer membrane protein TolC
MKRIAFLLLFIYAQKGLTQSTNTLSYSDYITNVLANNPLTKKADNEKKYGELKLKAARGNYDPQLSGNYDQKQFDNKNYFTNLNSEIKQPIFTSQYLNFGYDYGVGTNMNPESFTPSSGLPYLGMELGVLQGLVIDKRRAEVLKSKEYVNYFGAERQIQLNNLLFESAQRYFEWLFSIKEIALNDYFMKIARQRLLGIEALADIGERPAVDTVEAAIFYQTRLLDFQSATLDYQKSINELSMFNWSDKGPSVLTNTYQTIDSLDGYYEKTKTILSETLYQNSTSNPVLLKYNSFQKVLEIDNRLKKEMIKPVLNVKYNFLSTNNNSFNPAFSNNSYKWGVNLSFPLLFRNPTNEYKMAKVVSQNNNLELLNKTNELNFKTNLLKQNISILSQQLQNADRTAKYSKQLVDAEKLKFDNGESSLFLLNTRENKWLEAELKLAEYKLKFIKAVLNIIYLNGNLEYKL